MFSTCWMCRGFHLFYYGPFHRFRVLSAPGEIQHNPDSDWHRRRDSLCQLGDEGKKSSFRHKTF